MLSGANRIYNETVERPSVCLSHRSTTATVSHIVSYRIVLGLTVSVAGAIELYVC